MEKEYKYIEVQYKLYTIEGTERVLEEEDGMKLLKLKIIVRKG